MKNSQSKINLIADIWTKNVRSFLGIAAQWVKDFTVKKILIDMIEVDGKLSGDLIGEKIFDTIMKYEIGTKLGWITTDNASNNITAMRALSKLLQSQEIKFNPQKRHIRCINHVINLVVCDFVKNITKEDKEEDNLKILELMKLPKKKRISIRKSNITYRPNNNNKNNNNRDINIEIEEENSDEIIEDNIIDNKNVNPEPPLQKLRYLIKKVRSSSYHFSRFQKICETSSLECNAINLDCVTRWSSTYFMIKKGIKLSLQLNQFCFDDKEFNQYALSLEDWNELKVLCEFLKIFKDCDNFVQQENYSNSSHIIIIFFSKR